MNVDYIKQGDCLELMRNIPDNSINLLLTDIPYDMVNRESNGLRDLDKKDADVLTFNLESFVQECYRVAKTTIIFCGVNQVSEIYKGFAIYQQKKKGTVRQLIWKKTNPSPMNGEYIYLSGIENAIWFKKRGGTFNARCKNTVFEYPSGKRQYHPTQKNLKLFEELIRDNTNEGDVVFDPCVGSGTTAIAAINTGRHYIGFDISQEYCDIAENRIKEVTNVK
ncbi:MAG: site-specific DNA-methyltransferase [Oscillospiraceae bacterium]|nr:site-specific DNA-methyltransferase [Oscillospiraceae bacterium]